MMELLLVILQAIREEFFSYLEDDEQEHQEKPPGVKIGKRLKVDR